MRKGILICVFIFISISLIQGLDTERHVLEGTTAPDFTLRDKENNPYELSEMSNKHTILIFFNKELKEHALLYAENIAEETRDVAVDVNVLLIADMRNIPFFITRKFVIRNASREETPAPLLFDWEQEVNDLYETNPAKINIFIIGPTRKIEHYYVTEEFSPRDIQELLRTWRNASALQRNR